MARQMADTSMKYLKNQLFHTYGNNHDKPIFTLPDLRNNWREVQKEYPIILSTTFSSLSSLQRDAVYDYIIMDEASQVSVETGALALSCAKNAIIVGDTMQLPNVVTEENKETLNFIANACLIKPEYGKRVIEPTIIYKELNCGDHFLATLDLVKENQGFAGY